MGFRRLLISTLCLLVVCAVVSVASTQPARAGVNVWTSHGPGAGYGVSTIVIDPTTPTTLYAGHLFSGGAPLHKSADAGATWTSSGAGLPITGVTSMAIDAGDTNNLYAGTYQGVFRSTDGGKTWSAANAGIDAYTRGVAVDPHVGGALYAFVSGDGGGKIFKSSDHGATWNDMMAPASELVIDPVTPGTLYAAGRLGSETGLLKSVDAGTTWNPTGLVGADSFSYRVYAFAVDPITPDTLFASRQDGVFKSTDGGDRWLPADAGLPVGGPECSGSLQLCQIIRSFVVDPTHPGTVYATPSDGTERSVVLFKSTDAGETWSPLTSDFNVTILAADPVTTGTLYASTDVGFLKSTNGGATWLPITAGLPYATIRALAIDPVTNTTVFAATPSGGVFKSNDAGLSWETSSTGLPHPRQIQGLAIDPRVPSTVYAAGKGGVFKSLDGGATWSTIYFSSFLVQSVAVDAIVPDTIYAADYPSPQTSTDGGATWSAGKPPRPAELIDPETPSTVYAVRCRESLSPLGPCVRHGVFKSTDAGLTWNEANEDLPDMPYASRGLSVDPFTSGTVYAGTLGGLYRSDDGAGSWNLLNADIVVTFIVLDPHTPGHLYAVTDHGITQSPDKGETFTELNAGLASNLRIESNWRITSVIVDPKTSTRLYATTAAGVYSIQQVVDVCVGDCRGANAVGVDDLITLIDVALGAVDASVCPDGGLPIGGRVDVTVLIKAINNALNGCRS